MTNPKSKLDEILGEFFIMHATSDLEKVKGLKGITPEDKLLAQIKAYINDEIIKARIDEVTGHTRKTDNRWRDSRLIELEAKLKGSE